QQNINGLGAFATVYYDQGKLQVYEHNPYRGYISSVQSMAHFGLGKTTLVDSVVIQWNNYKKQTIKNVKANQVLNVTIADALEGYSREQPKFAGNTLFKQVTASVGIKYQHNDVEFIDFNKQTTLPHKLSEYCPALAAGDVDGNGLDDLIIGGNSGNHAQLFLQQHDEKFLQKDLFTGLDSNMTNYKDEGILLFDANGDGSPDVYIAGGGYNFEVNSPNYQDRLYINDGKGNFTITTQALPPNHTSKLCVRAMDFNGDGKPDLFVSGRVEPGKYPKPVSSFIYRNDTQNGIVKFTDVTAEIAPDLKNIGMVCDALFTDFDNDGQTDLMLAGEWMPVTFLKNVGGKFKNVTAGSGLINKTGWWNSIVAGDFRNTGRIDYIVGNVGLNTLYKASDQYPVYITANDFDKNGGYEPIPSLFLKDQKGQFKEFPANGRDDIVEKMPALKKKYENYKKFATATMEEIFPPAKMEGAIRLKATMLQSCYIRNDGAGKFTMIPLPGEAQISTINGMIADDFDKDGNLDLLISGNDFGTDVSIGRYDALNGLVLRGDGKGGFTPLSILESGVFINGNGKALVKLRDVNNQCLVAASQNKGPLQVYKLRYPQTAIPFATGDAYAIITKKNGSKQKVENYFGSSFLSQSAHFFSVGNDAESVIITNSSGKQRNVFNKNN
ncbi:MAG: FG-GAP-like repeat-containing protein, partial [Ginsengibacter sp.]